MKQHQWSIEQLCYSDRSHKPNAWMPVKRIEAPHLAGALIALRRWVERNDTYRKETGTYRLVRLDNIAVVDWKKEVQQHVSVHLKTQETAT